MEESSEPQDSEIENYRAKYGSINLNDEYFDDHVELGFEYLEYKLYKIKIWTAKKGQLTVLGGIQSFYKNIQKEKDYISEEHKGEKVDPNQFVEFNLQQNEYITKCSLWWEDESICKINFETNLRNKFSVGDAKGEEMEVIELEEKNKCVFSIFGTYNSNYLSSIGLFINKRDEFLDYFMKGYFELKLFIKKEKYYQEIKKKLDKGEYKKEDIVLFKTCEMANNVFHEILKFTVPF